MRASWYGCQYLRLNHINFASTLYLSLLFLSHNLNNNSNMVLKWKPSLVPQRLLTRSSVSPWHCSLLMISGSQSTFLYQMYFCQWCRSSMVISVIIHRQPLLPVIHYCQQLSFMFHFMSIKPNSFHIWCNPACFHT